MEENQKNKKAKMTKRQKRMAQKRQEQEAAMTPEEKFNQLLALKKATRCILSINETYMRAWRGILSVWVKRPRSRSSPSRAGSSVRL